MSRLQPPGGLLVWRDQSAPGPDNMAADEILAGAARQRGDALVRLYGWEPGTVSLGGFQAIADAERLPDLAGWPIVRRPSGGGAIVHGTDITYCLALPGTHPWARRAEDLYAAVHSALVDELRARGVAASLVDAATAARVPAADFFCFNRRAFGDVVIAAPDPGLPAGGWKVLGSAQRRLAGVIMQHGSLLVRRHPLMRGSGSHPGLADLIGVVGDDSAGLVAGWLERLAVRLDGPLGEMSGPSWASFEADYQRRAAKYAGDAWRRRR